MPMPQALTPPARDGIDESAAIPKHQVASLRANDLQRRKLLVILHLGTGVPEVVQVAFDESHSFAGDKGTGV